MKKLGFCYITFHLYMFSTTGRNDQNKKENDLTEEFGLYIISYAESDVARENIERN